MTLAELLISMTLAAGVAVAVGQVMTQLAVGTTRIDQRAQRQAEAALAMARLRGELAYATTIVELDTHQVTFNHPDVDDDGQRDTIIYAWSGIPGEPITRQINAGGPEPILERCHDFALAWTSPVLRLEANARYPIRLEYYENAGSASCSLMWSAPGLSKQVIPAANLFPAYVNPVLVTAPTTGTGLTGEYFDNSDFTNPRMTRTDAAVQFDWGAGRPISGMGTDTFSIRWTGQVMPTVTEDYTFYVSSDDGARLWVNGALVIDNWRDQPATEFRGASTGLSRIDLCIDAGTEAQPVRLDGAVYLLNLPGLGG